MRFTIRDILWLTVVAAFAIGWLIDHRRLSGVVVDANERADKTEVERAEWEWRSQSGAVAHKDTLRVIEESGLVIVSNGGKSWLERKRQIRQLEAVPTNAPTGSPLNLELDENE
jgi:hypothetical protein